MCITRSAFFMPILAYGKRLASKVFLLPFLERRIAYAEWK